AAGFTRIWIGVSEDNSGARRLYERLGYTPTGRTETYSYTYVAADGSKHTLTETAEYLEKRLGGGRPVRRRGPGRQRPAVPGVPGWRRRGRCSRSPRPPHRAGSSRRGRTTRSAAGPPRRPSPGGTG